MSIQFTATTELIEVSAAATALVGGEFTFWAWCQKTSESAHDYICQQETQATRFGSGPSAIKHGLRLTRDYDSTDAEFITTSVFFVEDTWQFAACTYSDSAAAGSHGKLYGGNLTTLCTELALTTNQDPVGNLVDHTGNSFFIGNDAASNDFNGYISWFGFIQRVLTLPELQHQQVHPHVVQDQGIFMQIGVSGLTTQVDWSGNQNHGAITADTLFEDVPGLAPWFCSDRYKVGAAAAPPAGGAPLGGLSLLGVGR